MLLQVQHNMIYTTAEAMKSAPSIGHVISAFPSKAVPGHQQGQCCGHLQFQQKPHFSQNQKECQGLSCQSSLGQDQKQDRRLLQHQSAQLHWTGSRQVNFSKCVCVCAGHVCRTASTVARFVSMSFIRQSRSSNCMWLAKAQQHRNFHFNSTDCCMHV